MKRQNTSFLPTFLWPLVVVALLAVAPQPARASTLDAKESEALRQARQLYKSGNYQEAAEIFSRLSAAHPDMPVFTRNAGAAYYYLKKPDPALSNLREYLRVTRKLSNDDRQEVQQWISEMEQLRAQASGTPPAGVAPEAQAAPAAAPVAVPTGAGYPPAPSPSGTTALPPEPPAPPAAMPPPGAAGYPGQAQPAYPQGYPPPGTPAPAPAVTPTQPPPAGYPYGYPQAQQPPGPAQPATAAPVPAGLVEQAPAAQRSSSPLPWIIGGAGVATLGLGGLFTYLYQSAYSDTRAKYNPDRESAGRTYSYLQFVCYGLGAAGVATAAILLVRSDHGGGTSVSVAPTLGPQLAGAELAVRY